MSELSRSLTADEFESGIQERILATDLSVDRQCAIRFEFIPKRPNSQLKRMELAVAVTALSSLDGQKTRVDYIVELARVEGRDDDRAYDVLNSDSIGRVLSDLPFRLYFSERSAGSWDDELATIVDESLVISH